MLFTLNRIKFEIVHEDRISLDPPIDWYGLPALSPIDQVATKLLANADRWNDLRGGSRDIIDLCVLVESSTEWNLGLQKAQAARNANPVLENLAKALAWVDEDERLQIALEKFSVKNPDVVHSGFNTLKANI